MTTNEQSRQQFLEFCELTRAEVRHIIASYPEAYRREAWVFRCSESFDAFLREFPSSDARRNILDELRRVQQAVALVEADVDAEFRGMDFQPGV